MSGTANIAEAKGFFREKGINGKVKKFANGQTGFDDYLSGRSNLSICNVLNVVLTPFDLSKHRIICTLSHTDTQTKVLAKKSRGINGPSDLRGKTIATVRATTAHFYIDKFLELNQIPRNEVNIVFMAKKQLPKAIVSGEVDAVCQHGMPLEKAKQGLKDDWIIFRDGSIHWKAVFIVAPKIWLEVNPEQTKNILKAILKADRFIQTHRDESIRIIAKAKGYSFEAMGEAVRNEIFFGLTLKQDLYMLLENMEQWAIDNNLVKRKTPRNYLDFIDYGPLEAVAPGKVTIIR
ncbi:MAG: ABC transporter substrate-binding protein [Desulfobacterales bacterium]|nr:ABC transporter substrate-binding protein [Desulfobacterales bacterium]